MNDIHTKNAAKLYSVTEDKVTPFMRDVARCWLFSTMYSTDIVESDYKQVELRLLQYLLKKNSKWYRFKSEIKGIFRNWRKG